MPANFRLDGFNGEGFSAGCVVCVLQCAALGDYDSLARDTRRTLLRAELTSNWRFYFIVSSKCTITINVADVACGLRTHVDDK